MTEFLGLFDTYFPFVILGILIVVWMFISRLSFYFFTTTTVNRFRFRYWTAIAVFNLFHLILAVIFKLTGDELIQTLRWQTFFLIDVLTIEIFINVISNRRTEIFLRSVFYFSAIVQSVTDFWMFAILMGLILIDLASKVDSLRLRKLYYKMFAWYMAAMAAPFVHFSWIAPGYEGFTNIISLSIGAIYSLHVACAIYTLYKIEKIDEQIKIANGG